MKVIIVAGQPNHCDAYEHWIRDEINLLIDDFLSKMGFKESADISIIEGNAFQVYGRFRQELIGLQNEDIFLFYIGHGNETGWFVTGYDRGNSEEDVFGYGELIQIFARHYGKLIFVNYCCHAMAASDSLQVRFEDYLLIGAMPKGISRGVGAFLPTVFAWLKNEVSVLNPLWLGKTEYGETDLICGNKDLRELFSEKIPA